MVYTVIYAVFAISPFLSVTARFKPLNALWSATPASDQAAAVESLLGRIIPRHAWQFRIVVQGSMTRETDYVSVRNGNVPGELLVRASSGVAASFGVAAYLRQCCNAHFAWDGAGLDGLPRTLPPLDAPIKANSLGRFRYLSNVCTFSYSYVWWGWAEWSRFLDWAALSGFNLPLAHVGQELVWLRTFRALGLADADALAYFTAPTFLAWNRMGNFRGWGGPPSWEWLRRQHWLQMRILARMRGLGMTPVLPAFAGFVPKALKKIYPRANITPMSCWSHPEYSCNDFVDPLDPLFAKIGTTFLKEVTILCCRMEITFHFRELVC